jgi:tartrate-resistant acid phosphatase type 5
MKKYNHIYLFIPFLLCTTFATSVTALPIDILPRYNSNFSPRDINILSLGDWGSASLGGYHLRNAESTSDAMKIYASEYKPKLILNTGDNFYYCGIKNTSDPQINTDYVSLFGNIGLYWYNTLGNHDYGFNPAAQLELNQIIPNWVMDDRYYHRRVILSNIDSNTTTLNITLNITLHIIVLDTNPCINDYRGEDRAKWDPCNIQYPTCSPMPGECMFHHNIIAQDCKTQLDWFNATVSSIPPNEWVFVLGHHKADEIDTEDFLSIINSDRVHLYLNGHNHNLEHYSVDENPKYITTGAAGMVIIGNKGNTNVKLHNTSSEFNARNHHVKSVWSKIITGFTSHTFTDYGTKVRTDFWDVNQHILHSFTVSMK